MIEALLEATDCGGNSGPYRRVWSLPGFSWMSANLYLPSAELGEITYGRDGDMSFVYSGGWGGNGEAVDAGFQHNTGTNTWSLFILFQGQGMKLNPDGIDPEAVPMNIRFKPGQTVQLNFWIPEDNVLRVAGTGVTLDGTTQTIVINQAAGVTGWGADGAGQVIKRMTSIGQSGGDNFASGSFIHNVQWSNVQIGTTNGLKVPWLSAQTGGQCMHPLDSSIIMVNFINQANEVDNITLAAS